MATKPKFDKKRPLSWSAISSFRYDPEQWYAKYVLKAEALPKNEMLFGSETGKRIANDPTFLPHLQRYQIFEYEMNASLDGIPLIGFADGLTPGAARVVLGEYKTGMKLWDQKRADEHGQFDMYLLLLLLTQKISPNSVDCFLHWLPTVQDGDFTIRFADEKKVRTFQTYRTTVQVLKFGSYVKETYKEMQLFAKNHV